MYTFLVQLKDYLAHGTLYFFMWYFVFVWVAMLPRMLLALVFYVGKRLEVIQNYSNATFSVSALVTVYQEDPEDLWRCLKTLRDALQNGTERWELIVLIDGIREDRPAKTEQLLSILIASQFATHLLVGNARNKRRNLRALVRRATGDIGVLVDSDTAFSRDTIYELCLPFGDPTIGGTTTAQRIHRPHTWMQRISDWMEHARQCSSQASMALFTQVLCLPGRAIAVRMHLLRDCMDALVQETFLGRPCISGDDRKVTNEVIRRGYGTTLTPDARVTTLAPEGFMRTMRMWLRWGRSSQRYTVQSPWLWRYPVAAFIYWTDILLAPLTAFLVLIHWPYAVMTGYRLEVTLTEMVLYATGGILLSMAFRQVAHLWKHPRDIALLPLFVLVATCLQVVRTYALITIFKVNVWGTRSGADRRDEDAKTVHTELTHAELTGLS